MARKSKQDILVERLQAAVDKLGEIAETEIAHFDSLESMINLVHSSCVVSSDDENSDDEDSENSDDENSDDENSDDDNSDDDNDPEADDDSDSSDDDDSENSDSDDDDDNDLENKSLKELKADLTGAWGLDRAQLKAALGTSQLPAKQKAKAIETITALTAKYNSLVEKSPTSAKLIAMANKRQLDGNGIASTVKKEIDKVEVLATALAVDYVLS